MRRPDSKYPCSPGRRKLGGEPVDTAGIHPPGHALGPGNMQYWPYLVMPGLRPVSRYQIAFAMLMFW